MMNTADETIRGQTDLNVGRTIQKRITNPLVETTGGHRPIDAHRLFRVHSKENIDDEEIEKNQIIQTEQTKTDR